MRKKPSHLLLALVVACALVAAACGDDADDDAGSDTGQGGGAQTTTAQPQSGGVLTIGQYSAPFTLDPAVSFGGGVTGDTEMAAIYDTIVRYDPDTLEYVPQTAESVTPNDDYTEWTIKLRPDIQFSDGTPYDAEAVVFGLNRHRGGVPGGLPCEQFVVCPKVNSAITSFALGLVDDIVATDDLTVTVTLKQPWTFFPYALSVQSGMIPSPTALKAACPASAPIAQCSFNTAPVGAGPFVLESFSPNEGISMKRNENYWGGEVHLDGLKFVNLGDAGGAKTFEALDAGELQAAFLRVPETVMQAHDDGYEGISVRQYAGSILLLNNGLTVNCSGGKPEPTCVGKPDGPQTTQTATSDPLVRQAVAAALDPEVFNDRVFGGKAYAGTALYQDDFKWDPGVSGPEYDVERAKELVAEAKAKGWDGRIRVNAANDPSGRATGVAAETMLRAAGMEVVLDTSKDTAGHIAQVSVQRDFDVANFGVNVTPDDGGVLLLSTYLSTNPGNRVGFKNELFDEGINDALVAVSDDEKKAAYEKIATAVTDGLPFYIFAAPEEFFAVAPAVHGVTGGARTAVYFGEAWMEQ